MIGHRVRTAVGGVQLSGGTVVAKVTREAADARREFAVYCELWRDCVPTNIAGPAELVETEAAHDVKDAGADTTAMDLNGKSAVNGMHLCACSSSMPYE